MERVLEAELMEEEEQVIAYAEADFSEPHNRFIELFNEKFPHIDVRNWVLDLGCGPGDISFRFAEAFPNCKVVGLDGSICMLEYANKRLAGSPGFSGRVEFVLGLLPYAVLPQKEYATVISNSLLHHLPDPQIFWTYIKQWAQPGGRIFVMDLMRPEAMSVAKDFVERYVSDEPEILQRDFYNSILAAFTVEEIRQQLETAGLDSLSVQAVSDRHLIVWGRLI